MICNSAQYCAPLQSLSLNRKKKSRGTSLEPQGTKKTWWNKACFVERLRTTFSFRAVWRSRKQAQNPTRNQKEPGNDDATECQKSRETSPGTLLTTRRGGRQAPEPYTQKQKEPGNDDGTECQKSRGTSPRTLPATRISWWNKTCFLEELRIPFSSKAAWGKKERKVGRQPPEP